jgi:hypothetical protein
MRRRSRKVGLDGISTIHRANQRSRKVTQYAADDEYRRRRWREVIEGMLSTTFLSSSLPFETAQDTTIYMHT